MVALLLNELFLEKQLGKLGGYIKFRDTKSLASISEQIISSGLNVTLSILIVYMSGIADLGVYSFCFGLSMLFSSINQAMIHKQMLLLSSARSDAFQDECFFHALQLIILLFLVLSTLSVIFYMYLTQVAHLEKGKLLSSVIFYIFIFNLYDLNKHFLFVKNKQTYSLMCTILSALATLSLTILATNTISTKYIVEVIFISVGIGTLLGIVVNRYCMNVIKQHRTSMSCKVFDTMFVFLKQGKFGVISSTLTWMQNQSLNPIMMLIAGPLIAGYVSFGRLFIMPLNVVNQGLINSSTPLLRRAFNNEGTLKLDSEIYRLLFTTYRFSLVYLSALIIAHLSGILHKIIPSYQNASTYVMFWAVAILISFARFWLQQHFFVQNRLKLLLMISIVTTATFSSGILVSLYALNDYRWIFAFVVFSEIFSILLITYFRKQERQNQQPSS